MGEINVPEHICKAWPSVPTASTAPTLLKVLVVSGKPFVIACTRTEDALTIRAKAASSELSLFLFVAIGIPFDIFFFYLTRLPHLTWSVTLETWVRLADQPLLGAALWEFPSLGPFVVGLLPE